MKRNELGGQMKAPEMTGNPVVSTGIWADVIGIHYKGMYGATAAYCSKVWYQPVFSIWLNNWQNESAVTQYQEATLRNLSTVSVNCFSSNFVG